LKIIDIRTRTVWTNHQRSWLFIEVATDNGLVGLGEASQSRNDVGVIGEVGRLARQYIGEDPLDLIERRQSLLEWPYNGRTLFAAVSGIEQALWDLCGKQLKVPVYQLLGGRALERVRTYANIGYAVEDDEPESVARAARAAVGEGYEAIKFYPFGMRPPGGGAGRTERRWIDGGIEIVRAVRDAVGGDVDILVDLMHQFQDGKEVREILRRLDRHDLFWVEDPFVHDDPVQLAELRRSMGPRLAGGAPLLTRHEWRPLLEARALDVIMPDVKWLGGIGQIRKLAAMAEIFGAMVSPHNASGPVATAASVHAAFSLANFIVLEYAWGTPDWRGALTRGTERIESGHFALPLAPGLGVALDDSVAAQHAKPPVAGPSGIQLPLH
jgi:galactonate dehydratase